MTLFAIIILIMVLVAFKYYSHMKRRIILVGPKEETFINDVGAHIVDYQPVYDGQEVGY
jgi:hypothetical protein